MRILENHDYVFPLVGYDQKDKKVTNSVTPKNVYGTSFNIGENMFLTAGHSIENALSENDTIAVTICSESGTTYWAHEAETFEIIKEFDIGIVKTIRRNERPKAHTWSTKPRVPSLSNVAASGFPYGLDLERSTIGSRSFKGYVVSMRPFSFGQSNVRVYELSFQCPRGLSGAAVITYENSPEIVGVVVGNHSTKMLVFTSSETISEENQTTTVEQYESLQLGIAVVSAQLFDLKSELLGGRLYDYLNKHSLLSVPQ